MEEAKAYAEETFMKKIDGEKAMYEAQEEEKRAAAAAAAAADEVEEVEDHDEL